MHIVIFYLFYFKKFKNYKNITIELERVGPGVRLYELVRGDLLHLELRRVDVGEGGLQTGQQLLPLLHLAMRKRYMSRCHDMSRHVTRPHRGPQLVPRQLAVLLQLLQPRRLQLRRALLARQAVYQHLQQTRVNISRVNIRALVGAFSAITNLRLKL